MKSIGHRKSSGSLERDHDVVRLPIGVELDVNLRQLGETHGKIVVGAGIVGAPARTAGFADDARVVAAAVEERTVEVLQFRPLGRHPIEATAAHPDLLTEDD